MSTTSYYIGIDPGITNCGVVVFLNKYLIFASVLNIGGGSTRKNSWPNLIRRWEEKIIDTPLKYYLEEPSSSILIEHPQRTAGLNGFVAYLKGKFEDKVELLSKQKYCSLACCGNHEKNKRKAVYLTASIYDKLSENKFYSGQIIKQEKWNHVADALLLVVFVLEEGSKNKMTTENSKKTFISTLDPSLLSNQNIVEIL